VGPGIDVLDMRVHVPQGEGEFWVILPIGSSDVFSVF